MSRIILIRLVEVKELLLRMKPLKERELLVSLPMKKKLKIEDLRTRIKNFLLNILVLWAAETESALELPATAGTSGG